MVRDCPGTARRKANGLDPIAIAICGRSAKCHLSVPPVALGHSVRLPAFDAIVALCDKSVDLRSTRTTLVGRQRIVDPDDCDEYEHCYEMNAEDPFGNDEEFTHNEVYRIWKRFYNVPPVDVLQLACHSKKWNIVVHLRHYVPPRIWAKMLLETWKSDQGFSDCPPGVSTVFLFYIQVFEQGEEEEVGSFEILITELEKQRIPLILELLQGTGIPIAHKQYGMNPKLLESQREDLIKMLVVECLPCVIETIEEDFWSYFTGSFLDLILCLDPKDQLVNRLLTKVHFKRKKGDGFLFQVFEHSFRNKLSPEELEDIQSTTEGIRYYLWKQFPPRREDVIGQLKGCGPDKRSDQLIAWSLDLYPEIPSLEDPKFFWPVRVEELLLQ